MTILDCHNHSWLYPEHFNLKVRRANMMPEDRNRSEEENKQASNRPVERILQGMEGAVEKTLILGLKSGETLGMEVPNEYLAEAVKPYPGKLYWAAAAIFTEDGAADHIQHCIKDLGAVAIGETGPGYGNFDLDDRRCFPVYEVARSLDIPLVIHAGPNRSRWGRLKNTLLTAVDEVAINFPELRIALCHMGFPHYEEGAFIIAKHENVYGEISWLAGIAGLSPGRYEPVVRVPYFHLDYPILYYLSQTFGVKDKLIWGTDGADPATDIANVRGINKRLEKQGMPTIPPDVIERIFQENWRKVFTKITD